MLRRRKFTIISTNERKKESAPCVSLTKSFCRRGTRPRMTSISDPWPVLRVRADNLAHQ